MPNTTDTSMKKTEEEALLIHHPSVKEGKRNKARHF